MAPSDETPEAQAARSKRSLVIALSLLAFVVLVFAITVIRMQGGAVPDRM
jgi:hypothetical protein